MARISGRHGAMYIDLTGSAAATQIPYLNKFSINFTVDKIDVTAFGDTNKVYVAGMPDTSGDFSGFYDTATPQLYTAASDGISRKCYVYPDNTVPGTYFHGYATFDFKIDVDNGGAASVSGSWSAANSWAKVG